MIVFHSMNTARKYHGKMKLLHGPDIHIANQPKGDSSSFHQYSVWQHSQHETLLDQKNITESRNCVVITHQNLASLWSTLIVYTLWIVIISDNLSSSIFLNNMTNNFQVFFLLCFSQSFSFRVCFFFFLKRFVFNTGYWWFCFACN